MNKNKQPSVPIEAPTPDYEAAQVIFEETTYEDGGVTRHQTTSFDVATDAHPVEREVSLEQLEREVHQVGHTAIETFMLLSDNSSAENRKLFVTFMGWGGNAETDIARVIIRQLVSYMPKLSTP